MRSSLFINNILISRSLFKNRSRWNESNELLDKLESIIFSESLVKQKHIKTNPDAYIKYRPYLDELHRIDFNKIKLVQKFNKSEPSYKTWFYLPKHYHDWQTLYDEVVRRSNFEGTYIISKASDVNSSGAWCFLIALLRASIGYVHGYGKKLNSVTWQPIYHSSVYRNLLRAGWLMCRYWYMHMHRVARGKETPSSSSLTC